MMRTRWRTKGRLWYLGLVLAILMGNAAFPPKTAFAAHGDPAVIGPLPAGGTIRVYVQQNVGSPPRVTVVDGGTSASHDGSGVIDMLNVNTGDTIDIYVCNLSHGCSPDPGWEDPQGSWWCGHNGVGDGI